MKPTIRDIRRTLTRPGRDLVESVNLLIKESGLNQAKNFIRLQNLPTRVRVENILSKNHRLRVRKRLDVSCLDADQLIQKSPGYFFVPNETGTVINSSKLLLNPNGATCQSFGARHLTLQNSTHTAGWDIIEHSGGATFLQLDSDNEQLIESYALNQKLLGWNRTHLVYRDLEMWDGDYPKEGVVLFGSYMDQWGHFVIDLSFRLVDNLDFRKKHNIFVQEGTPNNAKEIIRMFAPTSELWEVPVGKSITLKNAIVPLSRTLCPVGWKPELIPQEAGWGWSIDRPAIGKLPKLSPVIESSRKSKSRIFLERSQSNVAITNVSEVKTLLETRGFESIRAENMSLEALMKVLGEADIVVAGTGSHLLNLLFLQKPIKVIRLTHRLDSVYGIASALKHAGHDTITIVNDWTMPPDGSPYEMKQAPIRVELRDLEVALLNFNCMVPRLGLADG